MMTREAEVERITPSQLDDLITSLHRLATALEQHTLALLDSHPSVDLTPLPPPYQYEDAGSVAVPQVVPAAAVVAQPFQAWQPGNCPRHHLAFVMQPAGVSRAGKPYEAFWKCPYQPAQGEKFCNEKPRGQAA